MIEENIFVRIKKGGVSGINASQELESEIRSIIIDVFKKKNFTLGIDYSESQIIDYIADIRGNIYQGLPNFRGDCKLSTWVYTIAQNYCSTKMREIINGRKEIPIDEDFENEEGEPATREVTDNATLKNVGRVKINLILEQMTTPNKDIMKGIIEARKDKVIMQELNLKRTEFYKKKKEAKNEFNVKAEELGIDLEDMRRELKKMPTITFAIVIFALLILVSFLIQPKTEKIFYPTKPEYLKYETKEKKEENKIIKWIKKILKIKEEKKEPNWQDTK